MIKSNCEKRKWQKLNSRMHEKEKKHTELSKMLKVK